MGQKDDDTWEESGFAEAEEEAGDVKVERGLDASGQGGGEAPDDHDAGKQSAGAPFFDEQRAGDFEQEVTPEKKARPETDDRVVEAGEVFSHREFRDGDVRTVNVSNDVAEEQERKEAPVGFAAGAVEGRGRCRSRRRNWSSGWRWIGRHLWFICGQSFSFRAGGVNRTKRGGRKL